MKKTLFLSFVVLFAVAKSFAQITTPLVLTVTVTPATVCTPPCNGTATVASVTGGTPPYTYLWNIPLAPQTTQTATGLCAGTYQIGVFDASTPLPKQGQAMVTITCNTANSVNSLEEADHINIFPNPALDQLNIEFFPVAAGNTGIVFRNMIGSVVYTGSVDTNGYVIKKIDISSMSPGVYSIEFIGAERRIYSKFVKQ